MAADESGQKELFLRLYATERPLQLSAAQLFDLIAANKDRTVSHEMKSILLVTA
jgi:hypothetical protein